MKVTRSYPADVINGSTRSTQKLAVVLCSGGMDSVTLAYLMKDRGYALHLLSVDYGQRHAKEMLHARRTAEKLGGKWDMIDLTAVTRFLTGTALTDRNVDVPDGHYASPTMKKTVVPNRNAMMLAVAYAVAASEEAAVVATAVHAGDHAVYPDCRPEFIRAFNEMEYASLGEDHEVTLIAPFLNLYKEDIAAEGARLGVDFTETWSCYKGGTVHCGTCGTCYERREAFDKAGLVDPTTYRQVPLAGGVDHDNAGDSGATR